MSYIRTKAASTTANFLASAVGLIRKSCTVSAAGVTADEYGNKFVPAGTIWPANDATAVGILFDDVDVTDGDHAGSIIVAGRILQDRLPVAPDEKTALSLLTASGITFATSDETTRD